MLKKMMPLALAVVLLSACPTKRTEDFSQASPAQTSTTTQNPQALPENTAKMNPMTPPSTSGGATALQTVDVQLTDYSIRMPQTLAAGRYTFHFSNAGNEEHSFVMTGGAINVTLPEALKRGDTKDVEVNLAPGTYQMYCPVDSHREKGMATTLTVK